MEISIVVLKIELHYDPAIPLLGMYPKECKATHNRDTCTAMIIAMLLVLFTVAILLNQPRHHKLMNG
jgi:hypothetical protein